MGMIVKWGACRSRTAWSTGSIAVLAGWMAIPNIGVVDGRRGLPHTWNLKFGFWDIVLFFGKHTLTLHTLICLVIPRTRRVNVARVV